jgi:hypothetical protein
MHEKDRQLANVLIVLWTLMILLNICYTLTRYITKFISCTNSIQTRSSTRRKSHHSISHFIRPRHLQSSTPSDPANLRYWMFDLGRRESVARFNHTVNLSARELSWNLIGRVSRFTPSHYGCAYFGAGPFLPTAVPPLPSSAYAASTVLPALHLQWVWAAYKASALGSTAEDQACRFIEARSLRRGPLFFPAVSCIPVYPWLLAARCTNAGATPQDQLRD